MRTPIIAGNWKMNMTAAESVIQIPGGNNPRGCDYIRVGLSGLQGKELQITFQGQGDFCIQFHLYNVQFQGLRGFYPFFAEEQFSNGQTIGDDEHYIWAIIGGRENGGNYTLELTGLY